MNDQSDESMDETVGQPDESMDENMQDETVAPSPLLSLNNDTLFSLFDRCDNWSLVNLSETNNRLKDLLNGGHYYFPNQKTFRFESEVSTLSLDDAKKIFALVGRHFKTLELWLQNVNDEKTVFGFIQIIIDYCQVEKVQEMICVLPYWNNEYFTQFEPILSNLTKLRLSVFDHNTEDVAVDLTELCPNLRSLILWNVAIVKNCLTKTLPSLESFSWNSNWDDICDEVDAFTFFFQNPQLKMFECTNFTFVHVVFTAEALMPNIEDLNIFVPDIYTVSTNDILNLAKFESLKKLTLGLADQNAINKEEIIEFCGRLKKLSELKLYFPEPNNEEAIDFSQIFCHLERLDLYGVQLNEKIIADFVRSSANIKTMHFHECNVHANGSLLMQLENIAKSSRRMQNGISLFIGNVVRNNYVAIKDRKILSIDRICSHRFRPND